METLYLDHPYPSKKAIKDALTSGKSVYVHSVSLFGDGRTPEGSHTLCGPSEYNRKYYAQIEVKDGKIIKIK